MHVGVDRIFEGLDRRLLEDWSRLCSCVLTERSRSFRSIHSQVVSCSLHVHLIDPQFAFFVVFSLVHLISGSISGSFRCTDGHGGAGVYRAPLVISLELADDFNCSWVHPIDS